METQTAMAKGSDIRVTVYFDTRSAKKDGTYPVKLRLYHAGKERYISTDLTCTKDLWIYSDAKNVEFTKALNKGEVRFVSSKYPNSTRFNNQLHKLVANANDFIDTHYKALAKKSIDEVKHLLQAADEHPDTPLNQLNKRNSTLAEAFQVKIKELEQAGEYGNKLVYQGAQNIFLDFLNEEMKQEDIALLDITEDFLRSFEAYCKSGKRGKAMKPNSISVHLRALRHLLNRAIKNKQEVISRDDYPFENYTLPKNKTEKRAMGPEVIDAIRALPLPAHTPIWHHRNYWLFLFNCMGMNLVDLSYLKRGQIQDGRVRYTRRKTRGKAIFDIALTEEALEILDMYGYWEMQPEELVFPFLKDLYGKHSEEYVFITYKNRLGDHNKYMKRIAKMIGVETSLTSYVARHTWASIGFSNSESLDIVGQGLGHNGDGKVTKVYAKDLDKQKIDAINQKVTKRKISIQSSR